MSDSLTPATLGLSVLAAGLCGGLTAVARVIARRIGMLDRPDARRKLHGRPTPLMGGAAVYVSVLAAVGIAVAGDQSWISGAFATQRLIGLLLVSAGLFCLLGLWDDYRPTRPRTKILLQIAATLPFVLWGRSVDLIHLLGYEFHLGLIGIPFTIFWLVGCANVINLVDGLDGLAGSIALIVSAAIMVHSEIQGFVGPTVLSLILCGSLIGFLPHNWPPARIFLGDCGSLMLGFLIGALSIVSSMKTTTGFALAIPLVLVSVPIFDTVMAIVRRKLTGRAIGEGDRGHIHHRLLQRGLTRTQSLLAISGISLMMAAITLVSASFETDWLALGVCGLLLCLLVFGRIFGDHETLLFVRVVRTLSLWLADTSEVLRTRLILARGGTTPPEGWGEHADLDKCWNALTNHVRRMGGVNLQFLCRNDRTGDVAAQFAWTNDQADRPRRPFWEFRYSVPGPRHYRATLTVSGRARRRLKGQRVIDLFRLFDAFARNWLKDSLPRAVASDNAATPSVRLLPTPHHHSSPGVQPDTTADRSSGIGSTASPLGGEYRPDEPIEDSGPPFDERRVA